MQQDAPEYKELDTQIQAFQEVYVYLTDDEFDGANAVLEPGFLDQDEPPQVETEEEEDDEKEDEKEDD